MCLCVRRRCLFNIGFVSQNAVKCANGRPQIGNKRLPSLASLGSGDREQPTPTPAPLSHKGHIIHNNPAHVSIAPAIPSVWIFFQNDAKMKHFYLSRIPRAILFLLLLCSTFCTRITLHIRRFVFVLLRVVCFFWSLSFF